MNHDYDFSYISTIPQLMFRCYLIAMYWQSFPHSAALWGERGHVNKTSFLCQWKMFKNV